MHSLVLIVFGNRITMQGMNNMAEENGQKARIIHHYKNTKEKLLQTNAAMWFNKIVCLSSVKIILFVYVLATLV